MTPIERAIQDLRALTVDRSDLKRRTRVVIDAPRAGALNPTSNKEQEA